MGSVERGDGQRQVHNARKHRLQHAQQRRDLRLAHAGQAEAEGAEGDGLDARMHAGERVQEEQLPDQRVTLSDRTQPSGGW